MTDSLNADSMQAARNRTAEALQSAADKREQGENPSKPLFRAEYVAYDPNAVTYYDDSATLATVEGRVEAESVLPDDPDAPQREYLSTRESGRTHAPSPRR